MSFQYMVADRVWEEAGLAPDVIACRDCLKVRLGRKLVPTDFRGEMHGQTVNAGREQEG